MRTVSEPDGFISRVCTWPDDAYMKSSPCSTWKVFSKFVNPLLRLMFSSSEGVFPSKHPSPGMEITQETVCRTGWKNGSGSFWKMMVVSWKVSSDSAWGVSASCLILFFLLMSWTDSPDFSTPLRYLAPSSNFLVSHMVHLLTAGFEPAGTHLAS